MLCLQAFIVHLTIKALSHKVIYLFTTCVRRVRSITGNGNDQGRERLRVSNKLHDYPITSLNSFKPDALFNGTKANSITPDMKPQNTASHL